MTAATLTIDLDALTANWRALDAASGAGVQTAAVIKAGAYGLGAGRVGRALARAGARRFFVAVTEEAAELREALGPGPEINVFSGHMAGDTDRIHDLHLTPMINSIDQMLRHVEALPGHPFGVQLDSGMNRLGMEPAEWAALCDIALEQNITLIMSHLACADEPDHPMNKIQLATFRAMTDGLDMPRSLAATGGIFVVYLISIVLGFFGVNVPFIHSGGTIGILFSLFVVVIAALNLVLDFDFIERGAAEGAPKYMEWYGAFGLIVTLIWLYIEFLRLLTKLRQ